MRMSTRPRYMTCPASHLLCARLPEKHETSLISELPGTDLDGQTASGDTSLSLSNLRRKGAKLRAVEKAEP